MDLRHRAGVNHSNADALSRIPAHNQVECDQFVPWVKPTDLPCGGCNFCVRAYSQWRTFTQEVDDVVPLTSLDPSSKCGVVHNAGVLGARGNDHGNWGFDWLGIRCWVKE